MNSPLISIIVPVYKVERYIRRCIDSILAQTYTDWELLLVDDGSPDNSGAICDEYVQKDARIKVFHKPNGGVSSARNLGMERTNGQYICFIDSDDEVTADFLQDFVSCLSHEADVYIGGLTFCEADGTMRPLRFERHGLVDIPTAIGSNRLCAHGYVHEKLYRIEVLRSHNIRFDEQVKFSEDLIFILAVLCHTDRIYYVDTQSYLYQLREGSASGKYYPLTTEVATLQLYKSRLQQISKRIGVSLLDVSCAGEIYGMLYSRVRNVLYSNHTRSERIAWLQSLEAEDFVRVRRFQYISNRLVRMANTFLRHQTLGIYDLVMNLMLKWNKR